MKHKIAIFIARVLWKWITGKWVDVSGFQVQEAPDPLLRPIDNAIQQHFRLLDKWEHPQRKEIICAIINREWPNPVHIHSNPRRKVANG